MKDFIKDFLSTFVFLRFKTIWNKRLFSQEQ